MTNSHPFTDRDTGSIASFYGRYAAVYDLIARFPGVGLWREQAALRLVEPGDTVIEMGCGSGANFPYLCTAVGSTGQVVGLDITRPLLEIAYTQSTGIQNSHVLEADARHPPVCQADAILATFVCGMFDDPESVINQWCDLLGPGGRIALLDATASQEIVGRPLNPAFRAFTALSAPTADVSEVLKAPVTDIDAPLTERVSKARETVSSRTINRTFETFAAGFVGLLTGEIE